MFWLTVILGIVVLFIAALGGYQNTRFTLQNGGSLPLYMVAVTMLMVTCGIGLLYSAWRWRARRIRAGLFSLLFAGGCLLRWPLVSLVAPGALKLFAWADSTKLDFD